MISINERRMGEEVERTAERYLKKYGAHMNMLESTSLLSKVRPIIPFDYYALGKQFEAFENYKSFCEDDGTVAQLGRIPDVALDVITVSYGTSPIAVCASVQP